MPLGIENPTHEEGAKPVRTYFKDWKEVNGIKVFTNTICNLNLPK